MAIWEARAVFTYGDRSWENVWHIDIGSADDIPAGVITALYNFHHATLLSSYIFEKIVRRPAGSHDEFIESIFDIGGSRPVDTGEPLPLFNTIRLLLEGGVGRPGSKFLRGVLLASDLIGSGGVLSGSVVSLVESAASTLIAAVVADTCNIVWGEAEKFATAAVTQTTAANRQLHRKRRRST